MTVMHAEPTVPSVRCKQPVHGRGHCEVRLQSQSYENTVVMLSQYDIQLLKCEIIKTE